MISDTYFCIHCSKTFDNDIYYTMHSRMCNGALNNSVNNNQIIKEKLEPIDNFNNGNCEDLLYCSLCNATFNIIEFDQFQDHIINTRCISNHDANHLKPYQNIISNDVNEEDAHSDLYSSDEDNVPDEGHHYQSNNTNYIFNRPFMIHNNHQYNENQPFVINNHGVHFEEVSNYEQDEMNDDSQIIIQNEEEVDEEEEAYNGLSKNELSLFHEQPFISSLNKEAEVCHICQEDFKNQEMIVRLPCFHAYHSHEILKWLRMSIYCPSCKLNIQDEINS